MPLGLTQRRRTLAVILTSALLVEMAQTVTAAGPAKDLRLADRQPVRAGDTISVDVAKAAHTADGRVAIVIKLADDSVASYAGAVNGFKATNPKARGRATISFESTDTTRYRTYLKNRQDTFIKRLNAQVKAASVIGRTDIVLNAVSAVVPVDRVSSIAALPGVAAIYPDVIEHIQTDTSPGFIGAPAVWTGLGGQESAGEGVIIGVLDTGVWPEHPSFSDPDPSGKPYDPPADPPTGSRGCEFGSATTGDDPFTCNNKLIGAERFMDGYDALIGLEAGEFESARDDDGHGTHTTSTAGGNADVEASIFGVERGVISGIAPRAHVEMFKVCGIAGCLGSDTAAAVQAAIEDGVDIINFSISGGGNPYSDATELAFLDAYNAGVFVAASAGNSGPGADTTDHRGPWVTTVAASTTPRAFVNTIHLTADGGATLDLAGTSLTLGVGPAPVVVADDPLCGPGGDYTGEIVVCARGTYGRAEKGYNVDAAGGVGMILYNQSPAVTDVETDNHYLPTSHIQFSQGQAVLDFLDDHSGVQATLTAGVTGTQPGDVMASFSSRGGPGQRLGVSKPDLTAPGVQILAGASPLHVDVAGGPNGERFQAIAGTSMSGPHVAGSGALLKALHPSWTPGQIKSALMTTARTAGLVKEDGSTPFDAFDAGSGRVNLNRAGDPGLTIDATGADYLLREDELYRANYPSIYHPAMPGVVTLTRVVRSVLDSKSQWRITTSGPADFDITVPHDIIVPPGAEKPFTIRLDASRVPLGQTRFATIRLRQVGGSRVIHLPVTIVRAQAVVTLTKTCRPHRLRDGASTACTIRAKNPTFEAATFSIKDRLPGKLDLKRSSVHGAKIKHGRKLVATGSLDPANPALVHAAECSRCSPAGYLPLSGFGVDPIGDAENESISNYDVPDFEFAGEAYSTIGFVSNGYAVVGGGTGVDVTALNQEFPDSSAPNNVLAPFWTDLNPSVADGGGQMRIAILTDGLHDWLVLDWEAVKESSTTDTDSFQIWIGLNGVEDITFTYGDLSLGDGGFVTVGAENRFGNRGANVYVDGAGAIPVADTEILISTTPGTVDSKVITFKARNGGNGSWTNCATLRSGAFLGKSYACVKGFNK